MKQTDMVQATLHTNEMQNGVKNEVLNTADNETLEAAEIRLERALVGSLLADTEAIATAAELVRPHMFRDKELGFIYEGMLNIFNQGREMDFVLLDEELRRMDHERFAHINGLAYMEEALALVRDPENLAEYARRVADNFVRRSLKALLLELALALCDPARQVSDLVGHLFAEVDRICNEGSTGEQAQSIASLVERALRQFRMNRLRGTDTRGTPTGFREFDYILGGGVFPAELYGIAARPGEGKSMLLLRMLLNMAGRGVHCRMVNLEMGDQETANRAIASLTGVCPDALRRGVLTTDQEEEVEQLHRALEANTKLDIRFTPGARIESIVSEAVLAHKQGKCDVLAVDYLQLVAAPLGKHATMDDQVGYNINALKALAIKLNIPVIVVSQMNREIERRGDQKKLPMLSDLRNSGVIEQTSDVVAFVYRPDRLKLTHDEDGSSLKGVSMLQVMKNRNGATGPARFRHNPSFTKIYDYYEEL